MRAYKASDGGEAGLSDPDLYICYLPTANPYHELTVHGKFERPGPLMVGIRLP